MTNFPLDGLTNPYEHDLMRPTNPLTQVPSTSVYKKIIPAPDTHAIAP